LPKKLENFQEMKTGILIKIKKIEKEKGDYPFSTCRLSGTLLVLVP
jgi:hypothetical protein